MSKLKVLDLFCGAGGLSLGFEMAGFKVVGGVDFNTDAILTHDKNFPDGVNYCGSIQDITNERALELFPGVDLIIGGPPCQGFSAANKWQTEEEKHEKNILFYEYMRFVGLMRPKVFLIENVRQILTSNNSFAKNEIMKIANELGYTVSFEVLTANDYGVPQGRMRAFIIGVRNDLGKVFDFNTLEKQTLVTVRDAISDLYELDLGGQMGEIQSDYQALMRENSLGIPQNHEIRYPIEKVQNRMAHVPQGGNWRDVPEHLWDTIRNNRHSSAYKRLDESKISITIDTGHMNYFHPLYHRVPTVRESARLQSFPDDFEFLGKKTAQFMQVGNAVPPLMAKAVAKAILKMLEDEKNV